MQQNLGNSASVRNRARSVAGLGRILVSMVSICVGNVFAIMLKNWGLGSTTNMVMNDTLAAALNNILNAERVGKTSVYVRPNSRITRKVFEIMKDHRYIGDYSLTEDGRGGILTVQLIGGVNKCGAIKPRFSVTKKEFTKFEKRFLPSKDFGILIISTPVGIMTTVQAKEKGIGGKLLAYVY